VLEVAIRIFQSFLVVYPCLKIPAFVRSPSVGVPFCQLLVPLLFFLAFSSGFGSWCWRRGGQWVSCFTVLLSTSLFLVLLCYSLFLWFFFFVPSLFSFVLSVYFFRVLPLSFFRSQSLSISPAGSPWLFRAPRFYSCFSFPRFCPFSLVFLPPVRGFFFSLLCFFEKKQRNASLLFFFLSPPSVLSLSLGVFLFSLF
jgi:hypothetical protein